MNPNHSRRAARLLLGSLFVLPLAALAQPKSPANADAITVTAAEEPSIVLSPFVVDATRDTGYQAASTLAGTRLNTPLKDIGAAISVYTKDLLNDIGATKGSDLLIYATGMEAAGLDGNFSGTFGADFADSTAVRNRPQFTTRARGLAGPGLTRSFFTTDIPFDSYNTDAVTVNRGPNSILFGVGSPAGIIDNALLRPTLGRDHTTVEYRFGQNHSHRTAVDFNRRLIDRRLAVRIAAVYDQENFTQHPAYDRDQRIYGAITYEPFKSTAIRATLEHGRIQANRPNGVLPLDNISPWLAAGKPVHDFRLYDQDPARDAINFEPAVAREPNIFGNIVLFYTSPNSQTPDFSSRAGLGPAAVTRPHPLVNRDGANDTVRFLGTRNLFALAGVAPGTRYQGFSTLQVFDFDHRLFEGTTGFQTENFRALNLAVEQRGWKNRIGVELAGDFQRYNHHNLNPFGGRQGNEVFVDLNAFLANGQVNPNLGRPYIVGGQENFGHVVTQRETLRATVFARYDFSELSPRLGRWLGRHTLTGMVERNRLELLSFGTRLALQGAAADSLNFNLTDFAHRDSRVVYVGSSLLDANSLADVRLDQVNARIYDRGNTFPTTYWNTTAQDFATAQTTITEINNGASVTRDLLRSRAAILQSYWLSSHLITIVGWRRDEDYFFRQAVPFDAANPEKAYHGFNDFVLPASPPLLAAREIVTCSSVLRWPQRLFRLPLGADLGGFYNVSENFTPQGGRVDGFGRQIPSPAGETREFGLNLSLWKDKISFRISRFETALVDSSFGDAATIYGRATGNAVVQTASLWVNDLNTLGVNRQNEIDLLFSPLPANYKELYQYRQSTDALGRASATFGGLAGRTDTADFTATGTEFEVIANPTSRWRILANVAQQETIATNSAPNTRRFMELMLPVWNRLRNVPRGTESFGQYLDSQIIMPYETHKAQEGRANPEQRKWRANLITNYSFSREGMLKGWGVGGGLRWQDKVGIGYPVFLNRDGTRSIDVAHPYFASEQLNGDAWISHTRKLWRDRVGWKIQLNVRNLIRDRDPVAIAAQPNGRVAQYRVAPPLTWTLAQTFTF